MYERLFETKPLGSDRRHIHLSTYSSPTPFKQRQKLFLKPELLQREEEVRETELFSIYNGRQMRRSDKRKRLRVLHLA